MPVTQRVAQVCRAKGILRAPPTRHASNDCSVPASYVPNDDFTERYSVGAHRAQTLLPAKARGCASRLNATSDRDI
jgi:hypothetical protein